MLMEKTYVIILLMADIFFFLSSVYLYYIDTNNDNIGREVVIIFGSCMAIFAFIMSILFFIFSDMDYSWLYLLNNIILALVVYRDEQKNQKYYYPNNYV